MKARSPQLRMGSDSSPRRAIGDGGYNLSKSYTFRCTGCAGSFVKLMIVELTHGEAEALSKYKVQQLFNSSTNATASCPFCGRRVGLILSSNLMIGGKKQLDYKIFKDADRSSTIDDFKIEICESDVDVRAGTETEAQMRNKQGANEQLRLVMQDAIAVPRILKTYTQRLKGPLKWDARVIITDGASLSEYL